MSLLAVCDAVWTGNMVAAVGSIGLSSIVYAIQSASPHLQRLIYIDLRGVQVRDRRFGLSSAAISILLILVIDTSHKYKVKLFVAICGTGATFTIK